MAINVEVSKLLSVAKGDCETIAENVNIKVLDLLNAYNGISSCVQSYDLHNTIENLKFDIKARCDTLTRLLPETTNFLQSQMLSYSESTEVAKAAVDKLVSRINSAF